MIILLTFHDFCAKIYVTTDDLQLRICHAGLMLRSLMATISEILAPICGIRYFTPCSYRGPLLELRTYPIQTAPNVFESVRW